MRIRLFTSLEQLAQYADDWERLAAGVPFRGLGWLGNWWHHYGPHSRAERGRAKLAVLGAFDAGALVGIGPWHLETTAIGGKTLRLLGDGEVCSDYLSLLCQPGREEAVAGAMADYLVTNALDDDPNALHWDLMRLEGVDAEDRAISLLSHCLAISGCAAHRRAGMNCWRLELPASWDDYVNSLGKNFRRDVRRLERDWLDSPRMQLHEVKRLDELPAALEILIDLHQRRRETLGDQGCFASPRFMGFIRDALPDLLRNGQLRFYWLELDGRTAAAEFQLAGGGVLYAYQAGAAPEAMKLQPGKLLNLAILRRAIGEGYRAFDFLRGDEPYKARFGAKPRPSLELRIAPPKSVAKLRHGIWLAADNLKQWIKGEARS
jgi:CelD/BcsL family acetyltransferase involved in cellulose biosynthesis